MSNQQTSIKLTQANAPEHLRLAKKGMLNAIAASLLQALTIALLVTDAIVVVNTYHEAHNSWVTTLALAALFAALNGAAARKRSRQAMAALRALPLPQAV